MHRLQQVFTKRKWQSHCFYRVIGLIYPFVHVKEKGLQFHHGILHTPSVEREIYMFNAPDPSGDRRQTVSFI